MQKLDCSHLFMAQLDYFSPTYGLDSAHLQLVEEAGDPKIGKCTFSIEEQPCLLYISVTEVGNIHDACVLTGLVGC